MTCLLLVPGLPNKISGIAFLRKNPLISYNIIDIVFWEESI